MYPRPRPTPNQGIERSAKESPDSPIPDLKGFKTTRFTSKLWITPENQPVALDCWHYEYFRDPSVAQKYGVVFGEENATRLAALRVGFVRANYERNGGLLTIESMRWDGKLRRLISQLVIANADAIDRARINLIDPAGQLTRLRVVSLKDLRSRGVSIARHLSVPGIILGRLR